VRASRRISAAARELRRERYEEKPGELSPMGERLAEDLHSGALEETDARDPEPYPNSTLY
jgi:hypothetical protein